MDAKKLILEACENGNLNDIRRAISIDRNCVNTARSNFYGNTALYTASKNGHLEVVKELIAAGAKLHAPNMNSATALHLASQNGHLEVVKELIAAGANVDVQAEGGWTALFVASQNGHSEVVKELIAAGANLDLQANSMF
ncbi:putative ankyrin repeat protein L63 [Diplonema papillatum]|nr:putative ankyrin repeat protein L63 [Diplonema papillatum]